MHRDLDTTYNMKMWLVIGISGGTRVTVILDITRDLEDSNQTANYHGTFTLSYSGFNSGGSSYANKTYAMTYGRGGRPVLFGNTAPTSQSNNYKTMVYIEGPDMTQYQVALMQMERSGYRVTQNIAWITMDIAIQT